MSVTTAPSENRPLTGSPETVADVVGPPPPPHAAIPRTNALDKASSPIRLVIVLVSHSFIAHSLPLEEEDCPSPEGGQSFVNQVSLSLSHTRLISFTADYAKTVETLSTCKNIRAHENGDHTPTFMNDTLVCERMLRLSIVAAGILLQDQRCGVFKPNGQTIHLLWTDPRREGSNPGLCCLPLFSGLWTHIARFIR